MKKALTIGYSDSFGDGGIQRDLKVFTDNDLRGLSVITEITVKNEVIEKINNKQIINQLTKVFDYSEIDTIKIGKINDIELIKDIGKFLRKIKNVPKIILEPNIIINGEGEYSYKEIETLKREIFPLVYLLVVTTEEMETILNKVIANKVHLESYIEELRAFGSTNILIKESYLGSERVEGVYQDEVFEYIEIPHDIRVNTIRKETMIGAAVSAGIAKGESLKSAIKNGVIYIEENKIREFNTAKPSVGYF